MVLHLFLLCCCILVLEWGAGALTLALLISYACSPFHDVMAISNITLDPIPVSALVAPLNAPPACT